MKGGIRMKVFSERDLAAFLGVSPWAVRSWRLKGGLPHFRVSRKVFYRLNAVMEWMKSEEDKHSVHPEKCEVIV